MGVFVVTRKRNFLELFFTRITSDLKLFGYVMQYDTTSFVLCNIFYMQNLIGTIWKCPFTSENQKHFSHFSQERGFLSSISYLLF